MVRTKNDLRTVQEILIMILMVTSTWAMSWHKIDKSQAETYIERSKGTIYTPTLFSH